MLAPHLEAAGAAVATPATARFPLAEEGRVEAAAGRTAPNILEIGAMPYMWEVFPDTTEFYSSWLDETPVRRKRAGTSFPLRRCRGWYAGLPIHPSISSSFTRRRSAPGAPARWCAPSSAEACSRATYRCCAE